MIKPFRFFVLMSALFIPICGCGPVWAADSKIIMVVDASRSMWGQIDGVNKVVMLRNALGQTFDLYNGRVNLGLVAYGHRKESGCSDIELIRPLGPLSAPEYTATINKVRPKGSTPISNALVLAANSAGAHHESSSIILISDGLDNCRGNPCGVASEIKKSRPGLAIHVVAFDRANREELKSLACISQASGGTFASATNEVELKQAVLSAMEASISVPPLTNVSTLEPGRANIATTGSVEPGAQTPRSSSWQPVTDAPLQGALPQGDTSLSNFDQVAGAIQQAGSSVNKSSTSQEGSRTPVTLRAILNQGGDQISSGVTWRVFNTRADRTGKYRLLSTHQDAMPTVLLTEGEYVVNAAYGRAHLTRKIKVAIGPPTTEKFVLNAGGLRLDATVSGGAKIPDNKVSNAIYSDEQDQFGNRETIISNAKQGAINRLNAGIYHVVSKYGNANAVVQADVRVEPGKLTEAKITHQAGLVTFRLVLQPGGDALANTQWQILNGSGDVVKKSAGALPSHILASGEYSVIAKHSGQGYQVPFSVGSGEVKQVEVVIQ